jgi:cbb3-type cytochrome oxidase maturation protein
MEVLILLVFISVVLATGGVGFFVWNVRQQAHQHTDRLALLPLQDDAPSTRGTPCAAAAAGPTDRNPNEDQE